MVCLDEQTAPHQAFDHLVPQLGETQRVAVRTGRVGRHGQCLGLVQRLRNRVVTFEEHPAGDLLRALPRLATLCDPVVMPRLQLVEQV